MRPEADQQARLTPLTDQAVTYPVRVLGLDGRRLRCSLEGVLLPGELVQLEGPGWLLLGEVECLEPGAPNTIVVWVEHALLDTGELERQRRLWTD